MISSVQLLSCVWLFETPWTAARQASLSITNSQSLLKLMSTESVMLSNHLILCHPLLLPPSIFPSIRVFSYELVICQYATYLASGGHLMRLSTCDLLYNWDVNRQRRYGGGVQFVRYTVSDSSCMKKQLMEELHHMYNKYLLLTYLVLMGFNFWKSRILKDGWL